MHAAAALSTGAACARACSRVSYALMTATAAASSSLSGHCSCRHAALPLTQRRSIAATAANSAIGSSSSTSNNGGSAARPLVVLGIESSCDDTGAAVVTADGRVLGEALATQAELHAPWGGVVPALAQQAHRDAIDRVVDAALHQAGLTASELDAVAVTVGPGLSLCLDVGVRKARALSRDAQLPLVPVHHMEAHALVARMSALQAGEPLPFPFLCLLVSGGHNLLLLVRGAGSYLQLGTTLDDALGEAYDKVARMLGLQLQPNGGAALEAAARSGNAHAYAFALPMKKHANCDFSYAGLKTSVRLCIERELGSADGAGKRATRELVQEQQQPEPQQQQQADDQEQPASLEEPSQQQQQWSAAEAALRADIAASFQRVAVEHLTTRLARGITWAREQAPGLSHLVVAGGVASNQYVRQQVQQVAHAAGLQLAFPPPRWCTDNGVMVAWAGVERHQLGLVQPPAGPLPADGSPEWVELRPRWPLTSSKHPNSMRPTLSMKSAAKQAVSLTDLTQQELAGLQQQQAGVERAGNADGSRQEQGQASAPAPGAASGQ